MNGNFEVVKIDISEEILKEDKGVLEDLIVAATNNAKKEVESKTQEEMSKITGGLKMPPGFKFPM
jgi:DNA-binding YbaB/EbfC family protein